MTITCVGFDRDSKCVHRDMELVAEPVLIRTFNNPAEIVRICENEMGKVEDTFLL